MKKIIIGNWKSNPTSLSRAVRLAKETDRKGIIIAPPHIYLEVVGRTIHKSILAAQDAFWMASGPYTGEVSLSQLKNLGVKYVILGHSERRKYLGETDEIINKKIGAVLKAGMRVVLCVGEGLNIRKKGIGAAKKYVENQITKDLSGVPKTKLKNIIVAYEPVWAIGTGKADSPEDATKIVSHIKHSLKKHYKVGTTKVLYGGSVNGENAASFLGEKEIDGALIGGASLKPKEFLKIAKAA